MRLHAPEGLALLKKVIRGRARAARGTEAATAAAALLLSRLLGEPHPECSRLRSSASAPPADHRRRAQPPQHLPRLPAAPPSLPWGSASSAPCTERPPWASSQRWAVPRRLWLCMQASVLLGAAARRWTLAPACMTAAWRGSAHTSLSTPALTMYCPPQVRRVLEREPSLAATVDAQLRTPLHNVARGTSMPTSRQAIAAMLLAAAPEMAGAVDHEVGARLGRYACKAAGEAARARLPTSLSQCYAIDA